MSKLKSRRNSRESSSSSLYTKRKAAIAEAAAKIFYKKGFLATNVNDIAKEAEMDRASIYYYAGSKQDLYELILSESATAILTQARNIVAENLSPKQKLTKLIASTISFFHKQHPAPLLLLQEDYEKILNIGDPKNNKWLTVSKNFFENYLEVIEDTIKKGQQCGEIVSTLPTRIAAHSIIGILRSSPYWLNDDAEQSTDEISSWLAQFVSQGLSAK